MLRKFRAKDHKTGKQIEITCLLADKTNRAIIIIWNGDRKIANLCLESNQVADLVSALTGLESFALEF